MLMHTKSRLRHAFLLLLLGLLAPSAATAQGVRFAISFPESSSSEPIDGRVLLMLSTNDDNEPRFQISDQPHTQLIYGVDVTGLAPGEEAVVDGEAFGYPVRSLDQLPAGEYYVQALLNRYHTFNRSDGHTVSLPPDKGEGQKWSQKPGNLYSIPQKIQLDPNDPQPIALSLTEEIPDFPEREDTKYIKHVRLQSELLTEFWGEPMFVEAIVLLPEGWDEHPDAHYPLMVYQGHHHRTFYTPVGFSEEPAEAGLEGYAKTYAEANYQFYKDWTGPDFPRMILVTIQHANPYYDDSYAVNSENIGPYGDALTYELIPEIEKRFRGIGEGWARTLYGGSTGGWESLGVQIFYPEEYNGAWASCPDPVDFRFYRLLNIYEHKNAYYIDSEWKRTPRAGYRNYLGEVSATFEERNHRELAIATKGRSGEQHDAWQAVYSPVGEDGYPKPIFDKLTGEVDHEVANYWRENYDLRYILERDWATLGPKLEGKLHIYVGDMDNGYLNDAVYLMEDFLESTTNPYYGGEIDYGDRFEHCWSGDHANPNRVSRLTYNQRFAPKMLEHLLETAPAGADTTSWRY